MPPRTRKTTDEKTAPAAEETTPADAAAAENTTPTEQADPAAAEETAPAEPMVCIVGWCDQSEDDGRGVCREHFDAGWRFVKEPDGD